MQTPPPTDWRDQHRWHTHTPLIAHVVKNLLKIASLPFVQVETSGLEHLPATGGCVVACNHISNFDPLFIGLYLPRYPHYMAKHTLYLREPLRWIYRTAASFPIYRGKRDDWALRQAGRVLEAGEVLFMFPEGTRSKNEGKLQLGKSGAVKLALDYGVPIVPMAIMGSHKIQPGLRTHNRVTLHMSAPLNLTQLVNPHTPPLATLAALTNTLMRQIAAMLPPEKRGPYA